MNKKSKHKKPKVTPISSQKPDVVETEKVKSEFQKIAESDIIIADLGKPSEVICVPEKKIESESEKLVTSETIADTISKIVGIKDEETPKKPKRNRGKKKKGKDSDTDDNIEDKALVSEEKPPDVLIKEESVPDVTPAARKKKNKKGNVPDSKEEQSPTIQEVIVPTEGKQTDIQECNVMPEMLQCNLTEETKSKKKNKKKKKCDIEEVSCVAAFENLLQDKALEEPKGNEKLVENILEEHITQKDTKAISSENIAAVTGKKKKHEKNKDTHSFQDKAVDEKLKEIIAPIQSVTEMPNIELVPQEATVKDNIVMEDANKKNKKSEKYNTIKGKPKESEIEKVIEPTSTLQESDKNIPEGAAVAANIPLPSWDSDEFKDIPDESKTKKKNKKDKKHPPTSEQKHEQTSDPITVDKPETSLKTDPEVSEVLESKDAEISKDTASGTKPKAKIAKPVEKKRKGKQDSQQDSENIQQPAETKLSYIAITEFSELVDEPSQDAKLEPILLEEDTTTITTPEITNIPIEAIDLSENKDDMFEEVKNSKKKKKGPKPTKSNERSDITQVEKESLEAFDANKMFPPTDEPISNLVTTEISADAPITFVSQDNVVPLEVETLTEQSDPKILLTPEITDTEKMYSKTEEPIPKHEDKLKVDTKSNKKRRKSPKPHKREETHSEGTQSTATISELAENIKDKEESTKSYVTPTYDIEISTAKADETEIPLCDVIPDIVHPRASSQQFSDSNNNTFIREILPVQEIPILVPLSSASVELKLDDTNKNRSDTKKEEKTDIRSKMMEVNKDMEGLRLSIERSLAELTAMESKEKETELMYEQKQKEKADQFQKNITIARNTDKSTKDIKDEPKNQETVLNKPLDEVIMETAIGGLAKISDKAEDIVKTATLEKNAARVTPIALPAPQSKSAEILSDTPLVIRQEADISLLPKLEELPQNIEAIPDLAKELKVEEMLETGAPPICPSRKDAKNKNKKKKGKQEAQSGAQTTTTTSTHPQPTEPAKQEKTENKSEKTADSKDQKDDKQKGKQQTSGITQDNNLKDADFEPIENFEDALTSSVNDVNKTFEIIVEESKEQSNIEINVTPPDGTKTPVSQPKNLLGHPDIPVPSSKRDFKKEKEKIPNEITAKVKIKDSTDVEKKQSKNTQTVIKVKDLNKLNSNEEFVYKYSFRKVFLQSSCHVCKKDLCGNRVPCSYCNLVFYCSGKHKDEDWPQHQALCFAVSTIVHLKDQKHIYGDAKNITGHDYRLIRMQTIVSCEKVLKRRLVPWEQEALLYPRICAHVPCREWKQNKLNDCEGCGQISYCKDNSDHLPKHHSRWCKSYSLYQKLVTYQQTIGRLEPKLPTKVMEEYVIPENINEVFAGMYEEKIDMSDIQYAALTQLATAPLTAAFCNQLYRNKTGTKGNKNFTIHVVGAELQFEADALNKWEVFFLHIRPDLQELRVVLVNSNLNPSNLPLELLAKIKLCANCRQKRRRVIFNFQDKSYSEYQSSEDFINPDLVCSFNPSIQRASIYNGKDQWSSTVAAILKFKVPFAITAYTLTELHKDCIRIKECVENAYNFISEPKYNNFASVRPDRNFISDDEMPLLFKNYCFAVLCG